MLLFAKHFYTCVRLLKLNSEDAVPKNQDSCRPAQNFKIHLNSENYSLLKMDAGFLLRFPELAEAIFDQLGDENLTTCKESGRDWNNFLDTRKFLIMRRIRKTVEITYLSGNSKSIVETLEICCAQRQYRNSETT